MHDLSGPGALAAFFTVVAGLIRGVTYVIQLGNDRKLRRMAAIPPSVPPPPTSELDRRVAMLERSELDALRVRTIVLEGEVQDARAAASEIASDYARTAASLAKERERAERAEALALQLRDELAALRREIEGGHTRLAAEGSHDVGDGGPGSNDPTPPLGRRAARRQAP